MNALSLFSGCLGLDLGLEEAGFESIAYVENDEDCQRVMRARRPDVPIVEWVDVEGVKRSSQLRMLGNSVQVQVGAVVGEVARELLLSARCGTVPNEVVECLKFRGVDYSAAGEAVMRGLGRLWRATDDDTVKKALVAEAETFHAFHAEFPGLTVHEDLGREPKAIDASPGVPQLPERELVVSPPADPSAEAASRPKTLFEDDA